jgi:hypothetical protein
METELKKSFSSYSKPVKQLNWGMSGSWTSVFCLSFLNGKYLVYQILKMTKTISWKISSLNKEANSVNKPANSDSFFMS